MAITAADRRQDRSLIGARAVRIDLDQVPVVPVPQDSVVRHRPIAAHHLAQALGVPVEAAALPGVDHRHSEAVPEVRCVMVAAQAAQEVHLAHLEAVQVVRVDSTVPEAREAHRLANLTADQAAQVDSMVQAVLEGLHQPNLVVVQEVPVDSMVHVVLEVPEDLLANLAPAVLAGIMALLVPLALAVLIVDLRVSSAMETHLVALADSMALVQVAQEVLLLTVHLEAHVDSMALAPTAQEEEVLRSTMAVRLDPDVLKALAILVAHVVVAAVVHTVVIFAMEVLDRWEQAAAVAVEVHPGEDLLRLISSEGQA